MEDSRIYLLTGAAGFLGNNIARQLVEKGCRVRGLVLKGDKAVKHIPEGVEIVYGDLTDKTSLENFFDVEKEQLVCIHCASIVYLKEEPSELVYRVNVEGTRNVIDLCLKKNVEKLVYVSSTGTVAELPHGQLMREPEKFDLDKIVGYYGKTKAMATQLVFDAVKENDVIVISNSVADHGRILAILDKAGVIELDDDVKVQDATIEDIKSNPLNLEFKEIKPEILTNAYENNEGALIAINGNYAIDAGLNPTKDAVLLESADEDNPYVNIVACQKGHENDEKIKALIEVLQSDKIKNYITSTYSDGSVIPVK